jgi:proteic killer suppression protein
MRYSDQLIQSFKDKATEAIFEGLSNKDSRKFPANLHDVAKRKLDYLNVAKRIEDLEVPPGNRLEALSGDLKGCHSIRIHHQWRIIFKWEDGDCYEVSICDYH